MLQCDKARTAGRSRLRHSWPGMRATAPPNGFFSGVERLACPQILGFNLNKIA
jgi:hypothetical protein